MAERIERYCYTRKDFRIEWFSGTGNGGQNRNKSQACCRVTHIPSGLKTTGQRQRSRKQNFSEAFSALGKLLEPWIVAQINKDQPGRVKNQEVIRTYHFGDNRVLDHLSRYHTSASNLDNDFSEHIQARRNAILEEKMKNG
jgi:protein subunit release factor A